MALDAQTRSTLVNTDYMELTTKGRKSGKPRTVELSFAFKGEEILCLAGSDGKVDWFQNLLLSPDVSIRVGRTRLKGKVKPSSGNRQNTVTEILNLFQIKYGADYVQEWYSGTKRAPVQIRILGKR